MSLGWLLFGKGDRHITAEILFDEAMRSRMPVSLATVYNTLHQFTEAGLLRQLAVDGSKAYFDTNPTEHHHFFIEGEDALVDVPGEAIAVGDAAGAARGARDRRRRGDRAAATEGLTLLSIAGGIGCRSSANARPNRRPPPRVRAAPER